jgi:hypothetical protein
MSVWDDPDVQGEESSYVKFEREGQNITGTVKALGKHRFDDGKVAAQLTIITDTGEVKTVTAGQTRLKKALMDERPEVGDRISITYTKSEKLSGGRTLKHFDVKVQRGSSAPAAATYTAPAEPPF